MASQAVQGNRNVQIQDVRGSSIQITYGGVEREMPLERADVPVGAHARSPARLVRARSGVVPYAAREGLLGELEEWVGAGGPFEGCVIGGRGGSGKTRLAVELCKRVRAGDWLCGFLSRMADPGALDALVQAPTARLVVIDYAESRMEQLELLLPLLAACATSEQPVRVLLLVRASPRRTTDWTEGLRNRSDRLDALLDECEVRVLEDMPLQLVEREALFSAAAAAFAARLDPPPAAPSVPQALGDPTFTSPLLVVIAAYLAVHGEAAPPATRTALLDEVLAHEQRYWEANAGDLFSDPVLPRRIVGLATLAGSDSEAAAAEMLRALPDLSDASAERRTRLARWVHEIYPGPAWWNPLEPDLVGEHLVADSFTDQPGVLGAVLARDDPQGLARSLEVCARAAADHGQLAATLGPLFSSELSRLCAIAAKQAATETERDLSYANGTTTAAAVNRALASIEVDPAVVADALELMPLRSNLVLNSLTLTLTVQYVNHLGRLAAADPAEHEPELARALNNLSVCFANVGRLEESLVAIEEAVEIYRRLSAADPVHEPDLARSLNNLSVCFANLGRLEEGFVAIGEAVDIYRRTVTPENTMYEPELARSLHNLSNRLVEARRGDEGLVAIEEAVDIRRRLAGQDTEHEPDLARSLNNLSNCLAEAGRDEESLEVIEEAIAVRRRLVDVDPAVHEPGLASSLNNLSNRLAEADRIEDGLAAIEEAVQIYRRLVTVDAAAHEPDLGRALGNLGLRLARTGRPEEGLVPAKEAVEIFRRLDLARPAAHEPNLLNALRNLSGCLREVGRGEESQGILREINEVLQRSGDAAEAV